MRGCDHRTVEIEVFVGELLELNDCCRREAHDAVTNCVANDENYFECPFVGIGRIREKLVVGPKPDDFRPQFWSRFPPHVADRDLRLRVG